MKFFAISAAVIAGGWAGAEMLTPEVSVPMPEPEIVFPQPEFAFPDPKGACCVYDETTGEGTCQTETENDCYALSSYATWFPVPCVVVTCKDLGTCIVCTTGACHDVMDEDQCEGEYSGTWTKGDIRDCPASSTPTGACCYDMVGQQVQCVEVTEECCEIMYNSTVWYSGQDCSNDPCATN